MVVRAYNNEIHSCNARLNTKKSDPRRLLLEKRIRVNYGGYIRRNRPTTRGVHIGRLGAQHTRIIITKYYNIHFCEMRVSSRVEKTVFRLPTRHKKKINCIRHKQMHKSNVYTFSHYVGKKQKKLQQE